MHATAGRANAGKVGGPFANSTLLLLNTVGAKSGQPRIHPLVYATNGDQYLILASKGGAPTNPDWYANVRANPIVTVERGTERFQARATVATEPERTRLYAAMVKQSPGFAEYQLKTTRQIPVILLERIH